MTATRAEVAWLVYGMLEFRHPLRLEILAELAANGEGSPVDTTRRLKAGDPVLLAPGVKWPLGTVSYHYRTLLDGKLIVQDREAMKRGAIEHIYRLTPAGERAIAAVMAGPQREEQAA